MAFDFGPAGRKRLRDIARSGPPEQRRLAATALASKDRYRVEEEVAVSDNASTLDTRLRVLPNGAALPPGLRAEVAASRHCRLGPCVVTLVDADRAVVAGTAYEGQSVESAVIRRRPDGVWSINPQPVAPLPPFRPELATAPVEVRTVERKQLFIDDRPVGDAFE